MDIETEFVVEHETAFRDPETREYVSCGWKASGKPYDSFQTALSYAQTLHLFGMKVRVRKISREMLFRGSYLRAFQRGGISYLTES